jgi:hypothetical protein
MYFQPPTFTKYAKSNQFGDDHKEFAMTLNDAAAIKQAEAEAGFNSPKSL